MGLALPIGPHSGIFPAPGVNHDAGRLADTKHNFDLCNTLPGC